MPAFSLPLPNAASCQINPSASPASSFKDLGLSALDVAEVVNAVEGEFAIDIADKDADKLASVADILAFVASQAKAK